MVLLLATVGPAGAVDQSVIPNELVECIKVVVGELLDQRIASGGVPRVPAPTGTGSGSGAAASPGGPPTTTGTLAPTGGGYFSTNYNFFLWPEKCQIKLHFDRHLFLFFRSTYMETWTTAFASVYIL